MYELNTPGPVNVFVILDEHPDSINDGVYTFNAGLYQKKTNQEAWRSYPGNLHDKCVSISFADGHSAIHKWVNNTTLQGVQFKYFSTAKIPTTSPVNQATLLQNKSDDYEWLEDRMPYH